MIAANSGSTWPATRKTDDHAASLRAGERRETAFEFSRGRAASSVMSKWRTGGGPGKLSRRQIKGLKQKREEIWKTNGSIFAKGNALS
jgi:hypothetical protein